MNHLASPDRLPLVRPLPPGSDATMIFRALGSLPGRLWLDSSTAQLGYGAEDERPIDEIVRGLSRYSFLTADPLQTLVAYPGDDDPWPQFASLARRLPSEHRADLPSFQGGLAGVIGYEAARWLAPLELADSHQQQVDDLPTPALAVGLYDWTIAIDHRTDKAWIICQGLSADEPEHQSTRDSHAARLARASDRADQIESLLQANRWPANGWPAHHWSRVDPADDQAVNEIGEVRSNFTGEAFRSAVADIVQRICNGDSFQVNLAQRLLAHCDLDTEQLYLILRQANPAPFAGYLDGGSFQVLSSSPERFLSQRGRNIQTRPIKGTIARTGDPVRDGQLAEELLRSEKDRAENTMIVDLMRNDLSRVCTDESVVVSQLCQIERYQYVQHLVSVVEGRLRNGTDSVDLLRACFPGGSVTGAPKSEAMRTIAELEPNPRGPYCGAMGYIGCGKQMDFNILIRTMTATQGHIQIPVGGGITARSVPEKEELETWTKAEGMLQALRRAAETPGKKSKVMREAAQTAAGAEKPSEAPAVDA